MDNTTRANALDRFWSLPLGIQLAAAALVVAVPRYVIAFLAADNLRFHTAIEGVLLGVSALATAIIVAGGGAYVAHIVSSAREHLIKRALLLILWLVLLGCEIVLLAPPVIASLRQTELTHVLAAPWFDVLWSVVMVATPALCAAACVLAASLVSNGHAGVLNAAEGLLLAATKLDEAEDRYAQETQGGTEREFIPRSMRRAVKERCAHSCQYCQRPGTPESDPDGEAWHIDHVIPVVRGGPTTPDNLTLSCAHCNLQKGSLPPFAFLARTLAGRALPKLDELVQSDAPIRVVEVAPVMLECPDCGDPFGTKNALSAHKRFCKMRQAAQPQPISANGHGAHT